ncbi:MAG: hypothetical protein WCS94_10985 [Verrucomicrobiota bacterium]
MKNHGWTPMDTDENGFQIVHPLDEAEPIFERFIVQTGEGGSFDLRDGKW